MKKVLSKIVTGTALALSLSSSVGMLALSSPITTYASNLNYHTNYAQFQVQNVYTNGDVATLVINVGKDLFEAGGATLECTGGTSYINGQYYKGFTSYNYAGTKTFSDGNSVTSIYNSDTKKYEVTFTIKKNTVNPGCRAYFYNYFGDGTGVVEDSNGGYGYQIW